MATTEQTFQCLSGLLFQQVILNDTPELTLQ